MTSYAPAACVSRVRRVRAGRPGWDSNPHWMVFETTASAIGLPGPVEPVRAGRARHTLADVALVRAVRIEACRQASGRATLTQLASRDAGPWSAGCRQLQGTSFGAVQVGPRGPQAVDGRVDHGLASSTRTWLLAPAGSGRSRRSPTLVTAATAAVATRGSSGDDVGLLLTLEAPRTPRRRRTPPSAGRARQPHVWQRVHPPPSRCTGSLSRRAQRRSERRRRPTRRRRRACVIAEDEALIRIDLAEMLAEEGYDVVGQAGDGETAVALAEEHRPDLVVLDVKMPLLDGIAAAERIAAQRIAPVVILTAFSQRDLVERARDAGAMAYLVKPFTQDRPGAGDRDGGQPVRRAAAARGARSPTSPSGWRPASWSTGPRASCSSSSGSASPRRSAGSRRPRWTCGCRCAQVAEGVARRTARGARPGRATLTRRIGSVPERRLRSRLGNDTAHRWRRSCSDSARVAARFRSADHARAAPARAPTYPSRRLHDSPDPRLARRPRSCAVAALVLTACGGDGDDDGTDEPSRATRASSAAPAPRATARSPSARCSRRPVTSPSSARRSSPASTSPSRRSTRPAASTASRSCKIDSDSGDGTPDIASQSVDRLLAQNVDAIVGAASSGVSMTVIDKITGAGVVQFSPANTSPGFDDVRRQGPLLPHRSVRRPPGPGPGEPRGRGRQQERRHPGSPGLLRRGPGRAASEKPSRTKRRQVVEHDRLRRRRRQNFTAEVSKIEAAKPDAIVADRVRRDHEDHPGADRQGHRPAGHQDLLRRRQPGRLLEGLRSGLRPRRRQGHPPGPADADPDVQGRGCTRIDPELKDFTYGPESYDAVDPHRPGRHRGR